MYTDEELEQAVLGFLTTEAVTQRNVGGNRDTEATKTQVYEIIAAVFLLRPPAVFSVVWLATNALRALVEEQLVAFAEIQAAAPRVSRSSQKVDSVTDLRNAEAAVVNLTAAFSARRQGVRGSIGPGIQRFNASIDRFMSQELAKNVLDNGAIVATPEELRERVLALWAACKPRHADIGESVRRIRAALSTYGSVRLPDTVVGSLLVRMQDRLQALTETMGSSSAARDSRQALLELAAMKTLMTQASRFAPPERKKAPLVGDSSTCAFVGTAGSPATTTGTTFAPYNYAPNTALTYTVGGVTTTTTLPGSTNVALADVCAALNVDRRINATALRAYEPMFAGQRSTLAGQANVLWHHVVSGAGLLGDGSARVTGPADYEALGVEPGMILIAGNVWTVEAVEGNTLVLNNAFFGGSSTYYIGPDHTFVPPGSTVRITGSVDAGLYRVQQGSYGQLTLDRPLTSDSLVQVHLSMEQLVLTATAVGANQSISVVPGAGATALGLSGVTPSRLSTIETYTDLGVRGVEPGDSITLYFDANTTGYADIIAVDGSQLVLEGGLEYRAGPFTYLIESNEVADFEDLVKWLDDATLALVFDGDTLLDQAISRLGRGARYTGDVVDAINAYVAGLEEIRESCVDYTVPRDTTIEQAIRLMQEHGFDRAIDLFVQLRLDEFFALDAEGVSYKTYLYRAASDAARIVAPVAKDSRGAAGNTRVLSSTPNRE